jgi:hypothetical protein
MPGQKWLGIFIIVERAARPLILNGRLARLPMTTPLYGVALPMV